MSEMPLRLTVNSTAFRYQAELSLDRESSSMRSEIGEI